LVATGYFALHDGGIRSGRHASERQNLGEWFPKSERPVAAGWAGVGFSIGAMLAPPIIYFAHASFGWQGAFMFTGVLALVWVLLWWAFYSNPEKHPNLSKENWPISSRTTKRLRSNCPSLPR
jgi:ACS family hexuronate transporter-like MFS transporter